MSGLIELLLMIRKNSKKISISVIITGRNDLDNLRRCLDSIFLSNYPRRKYEVVYVDGGSTDRSVDVVRKKYPRVKLISKKCSIAEGRNVGIRAARFDVIAFTDTDCIVDRDWLSIINENVKKNAIIGGPTLNYPNSNFFSTLVFHSMNTTLGSMSSVSGTVFEGEREVQSIPACNSTYKKEVFKKIGCFNEKLENMCEDSELNCRVRQGGYKIIYVPEMKVFHKRRPDLASFVKQMFGYGAGRAKLMRFALPSHKQYFGLFLVPLLLVFSFYFRKEALLLIAVYFLLTSIEVFVKTRNLLYSLLSGLVVFIEHVSYVVGFITSFGYVNLTK